jgi:hypothetical protein
MAYQVDSASAATSFPAPAAVGPNPNGFFTNGSPGVTPATVVDQDWLNMVQGEICGTVTDAGLTLSKTNDSQLGQAVGIIGRRMVEFATSGTFTVPAGVTRIKVTCTGGGGGGSASNGPFPPTSSNNVSGGGGGAGGTAIGSYAVTPGQAVTITVGVGGATQAAGGTSSAGSFCSATGGGFSTFTSTALSAGGGPGVGTGGQVNMYGGYGCDGQSGAVAFAGNGGGSYWGGGIRAYNAGGTGPSGGPAGAGGGGSYSGPTAGTVYAGAVGANGVVVIEY